MEKTRKGIPISSTPHPQRIAQRCSGLFGDDTLGLSPITQLMQPTDKPTFQPLSKSSSRPSAVNTAVPKKKCVRATKVAASNGILEKLKVNKEIVGMNALSHSRNMYNMFPEPILLDSDDEDQLLSSNNTYTSKKTLQITKPSTETLEKKIDKDGRKTHQSTKRIRGASKLSPATKRNTLRNFREVEKKLPLDNIANIKSPKMIGDKNKKKDAKMASDLRGTSPSIIVLDEKDSIFSLVPDNLSDISDDTGIQYTPRSLYNCKANPTLAFDTNNHCLDKNEVNVGTKKANIDFRYPTIRRANDLGIAERENKNEVDRKPNKTPDVMTKQMVKSAFLHQLQNSNMNKKSKTNTFPEECVSHFERVVFKHNNHFGATVAKCLDTGSNDFGYLEIGRNKAFIGTRPNTTFVVLEGKVQACQAGASEVFSPGDILHISSDAEYQFANCNTTNARLLYIRDKRPEVSC